MVVYPWADRFRFTVPYTANEKKTVFFSSTRVKCFVIRQACSVRVFVTLKKPNILLYAEFV